MRFIGIIIAVVLALVVGVAVLKFTGDKPQATTNVVVDPKAPSTQVQTVNILVASRDIPVGTVITDSSFFDQQPWPQHLVLQGMMMADQAPNVIKTVARSNFVAREPLIASKLANPNDPSFLAANLPEGMRVVTIATDAPSALGGFIFPGDRVDVLFTHEVGQPNGTESVAMNGVQTNVKEIVTEVLVANAKILAVDQRSTSVPEEQLRVPQTVSLQVAQEDAQRIRLAEKSGKLSLALRSIKDESTEMLKPTELKDISKAEPDQGVGKLESPIIVVRGVKVEVLKNTAQQNRAETEQGTDPSSQTATER